MIALLRRLLGRPPRSMPVAHPTEWVVLARCDGGKADEFCEIRWNDRSIWSARGKPYTSGTTVLTKSADQAEAEALFQGMVTDCETVGFAVLQRARTLPGTLDVTLLEQALTDGAREAFLQIVADNPDQPVTGFALVTDHDGMSLYPAAMLANSFDGFGDEADCCRVSFSEWPCTTDAGLLLAYRMILVAGYEYANIPFERQISDYFAQFCSSAVAALRRLDGEGLFARQVPREEFLLLFGDSDGGPRMADVKKLNPAQVVQRYANSFDAAGFTPQ